MKKHTTHFKNKIKEFGRQLDSKITYELNGETIELGNEKLNSITPTFQSKILKSAMKQLDIDSNEDIPLNTEINYKFGTLIDNEYEYIDYGNYIVYSSEKQEDTDSYKIICYDKMLYSMVNYEGLRNGSFPMTVKEFLQNICKDLYIDFKDSNFANQDRVIEIDLYKDLGYTYRDVLDEISEVTASTICMNDDDELEVRYIEYASYDNEVTGETITINDNELDKAKSLIISGNLEQQTYSGKNLLNITNNSSQTKNGITVTIDNNKITINGKTTAYTEIFTGITNKDVINSYTMSMNQISGTISGNSGGTTLYNALRTSSYTVGNMISYGLNPINTRNYAETTKLVDLRISSSAGITFNNFTYYLQLEEGTQATEYEPYVGGIPSPNPDYPQEIDVVEGVRNLANINDIKLKKQWDGNNNNVRASILNIPVKPNTQYAFNGDISSNSNLTTLRIAEFKNIGDTSTTAIRTPSIFITTKKTNYISIEILANTTITSEMIKDVWVSFMKGDKAINIPYGSNYLINKIIGKNLLPLKANDLILNRFINSQNGTISISTTGNYYGSETYVNFSNYAGKVVTLSIGLEIAFYRSDKSFISYLNRNANRTQTIPNDCTYIRIDCFKDNINVMQIEEGTQATEYEPYKQTIINYDLQNNYLAELGDNIDTLDEASGVLNRKIGKKILNGSENWYANGNTLQATLYDAKEKLNLVNTIPYSTYFTGVEYKEINKLGIGMTQSNNQNFIRIPTGIIYFGSVSNFKNWLKQQYDNGTPVIIYYVLQNSETIELTPTQIPLNKGTNYLSLENNISTGMTLKYTNEIDAINEEYLKDVNVNFGEKYGPVNSIVLSRAVESDNVYIQDEESIEKNGLTELKIVDNQIMNFNDRSDYLPELLERLDGLEYYLNDFSSTGICYYDICDKYRIKVFDNTYECVMFNDEVNITQGLEENVYTDIPEETETDYTKADKTDQRINQTYLIVDKQNQKIESLASQVIDLTREKNGIRYLEINDAYASDIITLKIKGKINSSSNLKLIVGTKLPRGELYPSNDLFPSNSLHFDYDGTLVELPISQLNEDETLIIENNDCYIEKDNGTITHYGEVHITLNENDNYIYLQDFYNSPIDYYGKYAIKSEYTTVFTTKLEVDSTIQQTTDAIKLEVSKKADAGDIISIINQTADKIDIKGNRIEIQSEFFHLNDNGTIKTTGGEIGGLQITNNNLAIETNGLYNYNRFDQLMVAMSIQNRIKIDNYMTKILDVDDNARITATDYIRIRQIIDGERINEKSASGKFEINSNNPKEFVTVLDEDDNVVSSMGVNGINSKYITCNNFVCGYAVESYADTIGISMNGETGNVTCQSLTQTSLESKKKNFELLSNALDIVDSTDIYKYNFKNENDDDKKHIGFVIGENFRYNEDITSINNDGAEIYSMVSVLWKAVQEQQEIINNMQNQIDKLKEMVNSGIH